MCIQVLFDTCLIHFLRHKLSFFYIFSQRAYRSCDFITASIIDCNLKIQSTIIFCCLFKLQNSLLNIFIQFCNISDNTDFHIIFRCCLKTGFHVIAKQLHQGIYFFFWTIPVLSRKSIYGQIFNSHAPCFFTDLLYILTSLCMPIITRHSFCLCPTSVTIQDNRNMLWYIHNIILLLTKIISHISNLTQIHFNNIFHNFLL